MGEKLHYPNLRKSAEELRRMKEKNVVLSQEQWPLYDTDIHSFANEFKNVTPEGERAHTEKGCTELFVRYIQSTLQQERHTHLRALELGGPGVRLFEGFPKGLFEATYGVCLEDTGNLIEKRAHPTHTIIRGDLFRNETYTAINRALNQGGVDLILSRIYGGLEEISHDPIIWARIARTWYKLLREGGLMFVQYRLATADKWISDKEIQKDPREKLMKEWERFIHDQFGDVLDIQLDYSTFRLHKKNGAPKELPILKDFDRSPIIEKISFT